MTYDWSLTAAGDAADHVRQRRASAFDITQQALQRIQQRDGALRAFLSVWHEEALATARRIDDQREQLIRSAPSLCGIPVAVKDLFCTKGHRTTCGSRLLEHYLPIEDATVVKRLREAGAVIVGKTNMDEFGMGSTTEHSAFQLTHNPWRQGYSAGGSSGGSAAAVAADLVPCAIGSDTGGSVRQPAAWCGVTGLKPTYGAVSRSGMIAYASSFDQAGIFARRADDVERVFRAIAGHDPADMTSARTPPDGPRERRAEGGLRLGMAPGDWSGRIDREIDAALHRTLEFWRAQGHSLIEVDLPAPEDAIAAYYVIACCEASSNLARYDGVRMTRRWPDADSAQRASLPEMYAATRRCGFGREVQRRILLGSFSLSQGYFDQYYGQAVRLRESIRMAYLQALAQVDVLVGPVTPTVAVPHGYHRDVVSMYRGDAFTVTANLAGLPAMALPCGMSSDGLPIGLQLIGPPWGEARLLRLAREFQRASDWHLLRPQA